MSGHNGNIALITPIQVPENADQFLQQFIQEANDIIEQLNALSSDYNQENTLQEKQLILYTMYQKQKLLEYNLPLNIILECPDYINTIHYELFTALKSEFAYCGIHSMQEDTIKSQLRGTPNARTNALAEIIANMHPTKVSLLMSNLVLGSKYSSDYLEGLYLPNETGHDEFQQFIANHSIEFLGGVNAKNFKVTNLANGHPSILKVDYRFGCPKEAAAYLQNNSLANTLTPITAERQAYSMDATGQAFVGSIMVTDFCPGSDLAHQAKLVHVPSKRIRDALHIYIQMANILKNIVNDGCVFPDMKNSNWLVADGVLQIADSKSFVFTDQQGILRFDTQENYWYQRPVHTRAISPPELSIYPIQCPADKMHAFMLGKNLYHYLTHCSTSFLAKIHLVNHLKFNLPIFKTAVGQKLQALIESLIKLHPAERISVSHACIRLEGIEKLLTAQEECKDYINEFKHFKNGVNNALIDNFIKEKLKATDHVNTLYNLGLIKANIGPELQSLLHIAAIKNTCAGYLKEIMLCQFTANDVQMNHFIQEKTIAIQTQADRNGIEVLQEELKNILNQIINDPVSQEIRNAINALRGRNKFYTIGMQAKANRIEQAMANVPVIERANVHQSESVAAKKVLKELASFRNPLRSPVPIQAGQIVEEKAPSTYRRFKEKLSAIKPVIVANIARKKGM